MDSIWRSSSVRIKTQKLPTTLFNFQGDTQVLCWQETVAKVTEILLIKNVRQSRGSWRH